MKRSQAKKFIADLLKIRTGAPDDLAVEAPAVYPTWVEGAVYTANQRVLHNGILYKVLMDHTSQADWTPDAAPSLFAKVLISEDRILPWEQPDSTNTYKAGDKVTHNGCTWVSTIDNNSYEPGVYGWEEVTE